MSRGPKLYPFLHLLIPLDIKRQYTEEQLKTVTGLHVEEANEGKIGVITIELNDSTYDEWELTLPQDNRWFAWRGWRKVASGNLDEIESSQLETVH